MERALLVLIGLMIGWFYGAQEILHRDHVQGTAGIFIDGYDKNKIYKIVPMETK